MGRRRYLRAEGPSYLRLLREVASSQQRSATPASGLTAGLLSVFARLEVNPPIMDIATMARGPAGVLKKSPHRVGTEAPSYSDFRCGVARLCQRLPLEK